MRAANHSRNEDAIRVTRGALATANIDKALRLYLAPAPPLSGDQVVHVLAVFFGLNGLEGPAVLRLLADAHDAAEGRVTQ